MTIRRHTTYTIEVRAGVFSTPFEPTHYEVKITSPCHAEVRALTIDNNPSDPLEEFDEGEFYQFNHHHVHYYPRPHIDDFKNIVREHSGYVFTICTRGIGYAINSEPLTSKHTRNKKPHDNESCALDSTLEDADGYYICPKDVTDPAKYAEGVMKEYSARCEGDVYGIAKWTYTLTPEGEWELDEDSRDSECWGYYGYDYAKEAVGEL